MTSSAAICGKTGIESNAGGGLLRAAGGAVIIGATDLNVNANAVIAIVIGAVIKGAGPSADPARVVGQDWIARAPCRAPKMPAAALPSE